MWEAIQHVTTGLALAAFVTAVVASVLKYKSGERERLVRTAPEDKRDELVRDALEFFHVDSAGLTRQQRFDVALAQIHARTVRFRTTAIVVCFLAVVFATLSAYAISQTRHITSEPSENSSESAVSTTERVKESIKPNLLTLSGTTDWDHSRETVRLRGVFVTNGHPLTFRATKIISDDAQIVAFPGPTLAGSDGAPGSNGRDGTGAGEPGKGGASGELGASGQPGSDAGPVKIEADAFEGRLSVITSGAAGGIGGTGGNGGGGGNGARGEASRPGIVDCASGPGVGGRGGAGGAGAAGGKGGAGGNAGAVSFKIKDRFSGSIEFLAEGGRGGTAGLPGTPGLGGAGGAEGEARGLCRSAGRDGPTGDKGQGPAAASLGSTGRLGQITISLPNLAVDAVGAYRYERGQQLAQATPQRPPVVREKSQVSNPGDRPLTLGDSTSKPFAITNAAAGGEPQVFKFPNKPGILRIDADVVVSRVNPSPRHLVVLSWGNVDGKGELVLPYRSLSLPPLPAGQATRTGHLTGDIVAVEAWPEPGRLVGVRVHTCREDHNTPNRESHDASVCEVKGKITFNPLH